MAKKYEYGDLEKELDIQNFVESVKEGFCEVPDPRRSANQLYPLMHLIVIILCAIIAGANSITAIHQYAKLKIDLLNHLLGLTKAPSYAVFWWLLVRMRPERLQKAFTKWTTGLPEEIQAKLIAIDGKHLRGLLGDRGGHLVSAWDSSKGILLGQVKVEEKSNEITAIPELLTMIDVKGATVTIDAARCQKNIAKQVVENGENYILALKGNQETLHREAKNFFIQARDIGFTEDTHCEIAKTLGKGHGRTEEREIVITNNLDWLDEEDRRKWCGLESLIEVTSIRAMKGKETKEKRYYISSCKWSVEELGRGIRGHWSIENHLHWMMDVVFLEDASQANLGHAAENLAMFRRMALALIKEDIGGTVGVAAQRRAAMWDDKHALRILAKLFRQGKSF